MIFDKIKCWNLYFKHDIFNEISDNLSKLTLNTPNGEYFRTNDYYFKVMSYKIKLESDIIENHKREVDIQILLSGSERIDLYEKESVKSIRAYRDEDDCEFYKSVGNPHTQIHLTPNNMAVFFNQDIHQPQIAVNKEETIKKIVIKINEKFFT